MSTCLSVQCRAHCARDVEEDALRGAACFVEKNEYRTFKIASEMLFSKLGGEKKKKEKLESNVLPD